MGGDQITVLELLDKEGATTSAIQEQWRKEDIRFMNGSHLQRDLIRLQVNGSHYPHIGALYEQYTSPAVYIER